jgi:uncharacterized protein DUF1570
MKFAASLMTAMAVLCCLIGGVVGIQPARSQPPAAPPASGLSVANLSRWKFEELHLMNDRVLQGLIVSETFDSVDFMEIRRPPGRHMFLVMYWRYPLEKIQRVVHLPADDRQQLIQRIEDFKHREQSEDEGLSKLSLRRTGKEDAPTWHYETGAWLLPDKSPWLVLDSTAEEEMTRRSIVRIEQVFSAYREILPPRTDPRRPLRIKLFGTMREYQTFLNEVGLRLENPAVFVSGQNLLAAGSELSSYARQLAEVRERHAQIRREYDKQAAQMPQLLAALRQQLAAAGIAPAQQRGIQQIAQANWSKQLQDLDEQIKAAERKNVDQFDRITDRMFARLFHEAFHAYLENYVYPESDHDVPRWLNEGLAQIFEGGQLESGMLRLDAPQAERLKALQADLRTAGKLILADLLTAKESQFLVFHPGGAGASQQHYLYSWGLAWYLTFRQPLLETPVLDRYVERSAAAIRPVERFEKLVGMPLDRFEAKWRSEMLKMKSTGR